MKIALGCDHGGYELKEFIKGVLDKLGHTYEDFGCFSLESCDYPRFRCCRRPCGGGGQV